ncbi:MAG: hypothetical protein SV253_08985 [Halobacteria archaeon]|nr:hypothetical protein [Halobacteria archaeon]
MTRHCRRHTNTKGVSIEDDEIRIRGIGPFPDVRIQKPSEISIDPSESFETLSRLPGVEFETSKTVSKESTSQGDTTQIEVTDPDETEDG